MGSIFRFKQFDIEHTASAMKVGTDGVLLGAWAEIPPHAASILDVGTGSGLIALMMAQRSSSAHITGIEIDTAAAAEARANVQQSPWHERVSVICGDFISETADTKYDLIVSNPPFFTEDLHSPDSRRALARHGETLNPVSLLRKASESVTADGSIALITPASLDEEVGFTASLCRLNLLHQTHVCTKHDKQPSRTLWQFTPAEVSAKYDTLDIRDTAGQYTPQYLNLVNDFYLWLK